VLDEPRAWRPGAEFNAASYVKQFFGMFGGEVVRARLAFDMRLISVVLDHFGKDIHLASLPDGWFGIEADVQASPVFYGWMFQLGERAKIVAPENLRAEMRAHLENCRRLCS
jgi:predicted DNA-binding transcriptional regulator YafY